MSTPTLYGPDRAIYRHWLDRDNKAVQGAAEVIRAFRSRIGAPCTITRSFGRTQYVWRSGFDRFSVTVFSRRNVS